MLREIDAAGSSRYRCQRRHGIEVRAPENDARGEGQVIFLECIRVRWKSVSAPVSIVVVLALVSVVRFLARVGREGEAVKWTKFQSSR